jgi:hypothetical protein
VRGADSHDCSRRVFQRRWREIHPRDDRAERHIFRPFVDANARFAHLAIEFAHLSAPFARLIDVFANLSATFARDIAEFARFAHAFARWRDRPRIFSARFRTFIIQVCEPRR